MAQPKNEPKKRYTVTRAVAYGAIAGVLTGVTVIIYKFLAGKVIHLSETGYAFLRSHLVWVLPLLAALLGVAALVTAVYKRFPDLKGGGIPTSVAASLGKLSFYWRHNLVGTILLSLLSFLIGVPLGNEGPAVQIGTALGKAGTCVGKKGAAWQPYGMTGGACAGFSTATGAPVSALLFAVEEMHGCTSPLLLLVVTVAIVFSRVTSVLLGAVLKVNVSLFHAFSVPTLSVKQWWIPLLVGLTVGIFAVASLWFYRVLHRFFNQRLHIPPRYKMLLVYAATVVAGMMSFSCVSTGHHLVESLLGFGTPLLLLAVLLAVRTVLTLSANCNGITGGLFLPTLAMGALTAAIVGKLCAMLGMDPALQSIFVLLGITASVAGMMKTPLVAIAFSAEALSLLSNWPSVLIVTAVSFYIVKWCRAKSIVEVVLEKLTAADTKENDQ